jgi:anaphase-promoting complex subunit 10
MQEHEIGSRAVWSLSSAKSGNGIAQLRDDNVSTFWQSDGTAPHWINIVFPHRAESVTRISLYLDEKLDESYTPAQISVRIGNCELDLVEVNVLDLECPQGWVNIPMIQRQEQQFVDPRNYQELKSAREGIDYVKVRMIQIAVLSSHQNGRDTHIRQVKVYGPIVPETLGVYTPLCQFSSHEFAAFASIR